MSESQFIGRGEVLTKSIIGSISIRGQVPISDLINESDYNLLDQEIKNHKFDFVIYRKTDIIALEVNYKHGNKEAQKWSNIFIPLLESSTRFGRLKIIPMTIDDYDCRSLFKLNSKKEHELSWDDHRDVIDALEKAGVKP